MNFYHPTSGMNVVSSGDAAYIQQAINSFHQPPASHRLSDQHNASCPGLYPCPDCGKVYRWKKNMKSHRRFECGKEPQFQCPYCPHRSTQKSNLNTHIKKLHPHYAPSL